MPDEKVNRLGFYDREGSKSDFDSNRFSATVAILLCTLNGSRFLFEQLKSIEEQKYTNWVVIASDDGSTDSTLQILQDYQSKWQTGKLIIRRGPRRGFSINFQSLICDPHITADYYSFCDQDDVWLPEKLLSAVRAISDFSSFQKKSNSLPILYCGRSIYVSDCLENLGMSQYFPYPKSFSNALVQNIAGGNTMVMNHAAKALFQKIGIQEVHFHDWWSYLLISGANGQVIYDTTPQILYRQHDSAEVGERRSIKYRLARLLTIIRGDFKKWNTQNLKALNNANHLISEENQIKINLFERMRCSRLIGRFRLFRICGLYRQTRKGEIALLLAILMGKI